MAQLSLCLWHLWCDLKNLSYYCRSSHTNTSHLCSIHVSKHQINVQRMCWSLAGGKPAVQRLWFTKHFDDTYRNRNDFSSLVLERCAQFYFSVSIFWLFIFVLILLPISTLFLNIYLIKGVEPTYHRHMFILHHLTIPVLEAIFSFLLQILRSFCSDFHMILVKIRCN